jgi:dUTPase
MSWTDKIANLAAYILTARRLITRLRGGAAGQSLSLTSYDDGRRGMILSDKQIKDKRLIEDPVEKNFRATSYDLSVGKILTVDGAEVDEWKLEPSGVIEVISRERVIMPKDITGLGMVKTDLCNKGILALNIGIVGPGYEGCLSSILLNFSKREFLLTKNEVFLRLVFQECYLSPREKFSDLISDEDYVKNRKREVINFSSKFLNLQANVEEITKPVLDKFKTRALGTVTFLAFTLAFITFLLTVGVNFANRQVWSREYIERENIKAEILKEIGASREDALDSKIKELERKIDELKTTQSRGVAGSPQTNNQQP